MGLAKSDLKVFIEVREGRVTLDYSSIGRIPETITIAIETIEQWHLRYLRTQ